jgi:hypothetical protein
MSVDNRTQLNDCEDDTQTFSTTGSQLGTNSTLAGNIYEGAASIQVQHSNVYDDTYTSGDSAGATFNLDLSDSQVWIVIKDNGLDVAANAGAEIVLGDGTDRIGYTAGGSDAVGIPLSEQFLGFKIDVSQALASPGTADVDHHVFAGSEANLDQTQVTIVGYGGIHNAKAQGNVANVYFDGIYYISNASYALTVNGGTSGTPETMADVAGDDITNGWGIVSNPIADAYYIFANTEFGDDTAATDSYFEATDEQWFLLGDNGGGRPIGAGNHFYQTLGGTGTNSFVLTRVILTSTGEPAIWDFSDTTVETMELNACVFNNCGTITMPVTGGTSRLANDCIFNNCGQVYLSTLSCDGLTFNGTTNALGAVLWDANSNEENQDNLIFNSDGTGHAIEISLNTASLTTFNIDGYAVSGYETASLGSTGNTVFLVDNALDGDVTINVTNGVGTFSYERAAGYTGTVSIVQSVTVTITVVDGAGDPIQGAKVFLEEDPGGTDVISYGITNVSGQVTTSYTGTTPQAVTGFVRKGTVSPVYKAVPINDTIGASGLSATITMVSDE